MPAPPVPAGYRVVQLVDRDPPDEILRHAEMIPGEAGRYARVVRYRHDPSKTVYEVLLFKAGRPPSREEVLADLRADLATLEAKLAELQAAGSVGSWLDGKLFGSESPADVERKLADIRETLAAVEENYGPGEQVCVP
jgi:hypothetical protein